MGDHLGQPVKALNVRKFMDQDRPQAIGRRFVNRSRQHDDGPQTTPRHGREHPIALENSDPADAKLNSEIAGDLSPSTRERYTDRADHGAHCQPAKELD
jgi:hypothetical protein